MQVAVWDTYVTRSDGKVMHFDILVPSTLINKDVILGYGREYLVNKPFKTENISTNKCTFCHIQSISNSVEKIIMQDGFYIIEMENCH